MQRIHSYAIQMGYRDRYTKKFHPVFSIIAEGYNKQDAIDAAYTYLDDIDDVDDLACYTTLYEHSLVRLVLHKVRASYPRAYADREEDQ